MTLFQKYSYFFLLINLFYTNLPLFTFQTVLSHPGRSKSSRQNPINRELTGQSGRNDNRWRNELHILKGTKRPEGKMLYYQIIYQNIHKTVVFHIFAEFCSTFRQDRIYKYVHYIFVEISSTDCMRNPYATPNIHKWKPSRTTCSRQRCAPYTPARQFFQFLRFYRHTFLWRLHLLSTSPEFECNFRSMLRILQQDVR